MVAFESQSDRAVVLLLGGVAGAVIAYVAIRSYVQRPSPPPAAILAPPAQQPPATVPTIPSVPAPPATPNTLGCTPTSSVLPPGAVSQAGALLALDPSSPDARRRPSALSVDTMRRLARDLRYCGSALGLQPARDKIVADLEQKALDFEAALRNQPGAA